MWLISAILHSRSFFFFFFFITELLLIRYPHSHHNDKVDAADGDYIDFLGTNRVPRPVLIAFMYLMVIRWL